MHIKKEVRWRTLYFDIHRGMKKKFANIYLILSVVCIIIAVGMHQYVLSMVLIALFYIIPLIILFILNPLYKRTNHFTNQYVDIHKFMNNSTLLSKNSFWDVVNLGSTHPKFAFDFSESSLKGMNWAVGPQTLEYDFMILRNYHHSLREGATVIIPICPLTFFLYKYSNMRNVAKYYKVFASDLIPDFDSNQYFKEIKYPLICYPFRLRYLIKDIPKDRRLEMIDNPMSPERIETDATMWIEKCWNSEFGIDICHMQKLSDNNLQAIENNVSLLREIVVFCKEHNYHPVITYLPVSRELGEKFSSEFIEKHIHSYVNRAISGLDVPVLDYMKDERFQSSDYYINSFFMNRKGARYFTNIFLRELGQRGAGGVH